MFTSNFARMRRLTPDLRPVSISIKPPYWLPKSVARDLRLAPTVEMLTMSAADYDSLFDDLLATLDPQQIFNSLGDNAVLLCYESPNVRCHRRRVAEWLETSLGIVVPEFGFDRDFSLPYRDQPLKVAKTSSVAR